MITWCTRTNQRSQVMSKWKKGRFDLVCFLVAGGNRGRQVSENHVLTACRENVPKVFDRWKDRSRSRCGESKATLDWRRKNRCWESGERGSSLLLQKWSCTWWFWPCWTRTKTLWTLFAVNWAVGRDVYYVIICKCVSHYLQCGCHIDRDPLLQASWWQTRTTRATKKPSCCPDCSAGRKVIRFTSACHGKSECGVRHARQSWN